MSVESGLCKTGENLRSQISLFRNRFLDLVLFAVLLLLVTSARAAADDRDLSFIYDADHKTFVAPVASVPLYISGGTIIDATGADPRPNPGIVVADGVIVRFDTVAPSDARHIDATGKWILPGLFDLHAHPTFYLPGMLNVESDVLNAIRTERFLEVYQRAGITTVRDVASRNNVGYTLKRAQRMGLMAGSRFYVSGPGITVSGGHATEFQPNAGHPYAVTADGPWGIRGRVREAAAMGADFIKIMPPLTQEEMDAAVDEAHSWRLRVTAHIGGFQDPGRVSARRSVNAGVDSVEHLYPYGADPKATAQVIADMAKKDVYVIPTLRFNLGQLSATSPAGRRWLQDNLSHDKQSVMSLFSQMKEAGIKFGVGTDSNAPDLLAIDKLYAEELNLMSSGGLSPMEVIQAATANSANAMGLGKEVGTIVVGKWADLILVDENPLQDISKLVAPSMVVQAGSVVFQK